MRNDKVTFLHLPVAEPNDIEVQGSGTPPFGPLPALPALDCLARLKQGSRLQVGFEQHHLVEIGWLVHAGEWGRFFDGGGGDQPGSGQRP